MRAVVVVPAPGGGPDEVARRLAAWPDTTVQRVWAGDPHLRPPGSWYDDGGTVAELPTGVVRAALRSDLRGLVLGLDAVAHGDGPAVLIDAATARIRRPFDPPSDAVGVVARGVPPIDGLAPTLADLADLGPYSAAALAAPPDLAAELVRRILDACTSDRSAGSILGAALSGLPVVHLPGEIVGWPLAPGIDAADVAVLDFAHLHPTERWRLDVGPAPARVRLSDRPDVDIPDASGGNPSPLRLPGGIEVDPVMARLVAQSLVAARRGDGTLPPDPWREPRAFVDWLETPAHPWEPDVGRYWYALWGARPDLRAAFPEVAGADILRFREWADRRSLHEGTSPYLRSVAPRCATPWPSDGRRPGGVDLLGYFGAEVSLANVADRMLASLDAVGLPHRTLDLQRTGSPRRERPVDDVLGYDTAIVVANHDQVAPLLARHGEVLAGRRLIGFWHWDVEHVPERVASEMRHFDQLWVLNEYTERTLSAVPGAPPVRSLPLPVPEPTVSGATRADLGLPTDRQVVLVTFDHLGVTERKNPLGAIEAFRRAFPAPSPTGPVLVVKTMNAEQRWVEHERIRFSARGRDDIVVVDRLLPKADQMALVAHADVLLSLHRAEGLGLHLVEAMWLGTPTIATRYSGNLSFMDDENSMLVDAHLVPVERGEGFFPPEASWAEPDVDQAADHLRRVLAEPGLADRLRAAGRRRMEQQPTFEEMGRTIAAWCGIEAR